MPQASRDSGVPRLAYRVAEAAQVIGISEDLFAREVAPQLRWTRRGRVKIVAATELQAWLELSAEHVLEGAA